MLVQIQSREETFNLWVWWIFQISLRTDVCKKIARCKYTQNARNVAKLRKISDKVFIIRFICVSVKFKNAKIYKTNTIYIYLQSIYDNVIYLLYF